MRCGDGSNVVQFQKGLSEPVFEQQDGTGACLGRS